MVTRNDRTRTRNPLQTVTLVVGIVFLLVGIAGFIPGVTAHLDHLTFAGHDSGATLIGLFQVSILHNIVHLLFGLAGVVAARTAAGSRLYLIAGGVIYLALWIYGLAIDPMSRANVVPVNNADNWLHLILGVGMVLLGIVLGRFVARDRPVVSVEGG